MSDGCARGGLERLSGILRLAERDEGRFYFAATPLREEGGEGIQ